MWHSLLVKGSLAPQRQENQDEARLESSPGAVLGGPDPVTSQERAQVRPSGTQGWG